MKLFPKLIAFREKALHLKKGGLIFNVNKVVAGIGPSCILVVVIGSFYWCLLPQGKVLGVAFARSIIRLITLAEDKFVEY